MPKRKDINRILIIGSGPIIIGQGCEFDYSGTQACKVLKQDGFHVVLINSNPATIMTDPATADEIYIEPITPENIKKIILKEKVEAVLPTIGGQTSLNMVVKVAESGFFDQHKIKIIGADIEAIKKAEDRKVFQNLINDLGYQMIEAHYAYSESDAMKIIQQLSFPVVLRSSFTLGGSGGSVVYNLEEFQACVEKGLSLSLINEVTIEKSILGHKEYELEVMKDEQGNVVIICAIENIDPLGIHTGDSITVAPQQTLSDQAYQQLRNMSINIIKAVGVSTGGANIQYAVDPLTRKVYVIEMNPRVSRSSALASKATGFPIAKIAAKLAVGYSLDEIKNDITKTTPACFEPTLDYVVTKIPRFDFEKFSSTSTTLGIQMKSVGEVMAIGRTFKESFQKAIRSLENKRIGFDGIFFSYQKIKDFSALQLDQYIKENRSQLEAIKKFVLEGHYNRIYYLKDLFFFNLSVKEIYSLCKIEFWFLDQLKNIFDLEKKYWKKPMSDLDFNEWKELKQNGFSDHQLAIMFDSDEKTIRAKRKELNLIPNYKMVDTCAGEFESITPYYYSTYDEENEIRLTDPTKKSIIIFGGGPNRIGQGIEFDYMCVQASEALREMGYRSIMVNSNPETVSTDYDVSDILFFEPLTSEDTLNIIDAINPYGVILHLGGQTPLNLASTFSQYKVPILGTNPESIELSENRKEFKKVLIQLDCLQPENDTALELKEGMEIAQKIGFPVLVRPSYVLGGKAMKIVYDEEEFQEFFLLAQEAMTDQPILIDKFLEGATEVDIDLISDEQSVIICGILEHIEAAGVHSGDSACITPPLHLSQLIIDEMIKQATKIALALKIKGFMNLQFAIKNEQVYFIEANPRGSRTIPFISKADGISWTKTAVKAILGEKLSEHDRQQSFPNSKKNKVAVKEVTLPFDKFPEEDSLLGPEMKSTGEVMGLGKNKFEAFYKVQQAIQLPLPQEGGVLISIKTKQYQNLDQIFRQLIDLKFTIYATEGTYQFLKQHHIDCQLVHKLGEERPDIRDLIINGKIQLIFNTPIGKKGKISDKYIRLLARQYKISVFTVPETFGICVGAIKEYKERDFKVYSLKEIYS